MAGVVTTWARGEERRELLREKNELYASAGSWKQREIKEKMEILQKR